MAKENETEEDNITPQKTLNYKLLADTQKLSGDDLVRHMQELAKKNTLLGRVAGNITSYSVKPGKYGDEIAFYGEFVAESAVTGKQFTASKVYFDKAFTEQLKAQFDKKGASDGVNSYVEFAAEITVVESERGSQKFTYVARPVRTPEVITRQKELLAKLAAAGPLKITGPSAKKK